MNKTIIFTLFICAAVALWMYDKELSPQNAFGAIKTTEATASANNAPYKKIAATLLHDKMQQGEPFIIFDVRTKEEYAEGHIPGSILLPYNEIDKHPTLLPEDKNSTIAVYCRSGRRSEIAARALLELGYQNVYDMGSISNWKYELKK